jgi:hypothetical protein
MSVIEVSAVAGDLLRALERPGGAMRLDRFVSGQPCSRDVALMAVGQLHQAGLVTVHPVLGDWLIQTRETTTCLPRL